jgi:hypothetical protein
MVGIFPVLILVPHSLLVVGPTPVMCRSYTWVGNKVTNTFKAKFKIDKLIFCVVLESVHILKEGYLSACMQSAINCKVK